MQSCIRSLPGSACRIGSRCKLCDAFADDAEAREHGHDPLGTVADQRHHDVAAAGAVALHRARQPRRAVGDLAEGPGPAGAVAGQLDERQRAGIAALDDVPGEVHAGILSEQDETDPGARETKWP